MRPQVETICSTCSKKFLKDGSEVRRNAKLGRRNFCSLNCVGTASNSHLGREGNIAVLKRYWEKNKGKVRNQFAEYLRRSRSRRKNKDKILITTEDLKIQWNKQNGICPYTGVKLEHPKYTKNNFIYTASLDRIDSSKGYIPGNIQFISITANYAKSDMSHELMIEFCKLVTKKWSNETLDNQP